MDRRTLALLSLLPIAVATLVLAVPESEAQRTVPLLAPNEARQELERATRQAKDAAVRAEAFAQEAEEASASADQSAREAAARLRALVAQLVVARQAEIEAGNAPDDLATKIMTTADPETGARFSESEMVDQVAIFFLAGHETSAALLGWALWCLAAAPEWGAQVAEEARVFMEAPDFAALSKLPVTRNALRETLRLYPPVPMFVREATAAQVFRKRNVKPGAQVVVSPWHLGRHEARWPDPDVFDPGRWAGGKPAREAWLPFSAGPRVCPGAGFAMAEGAILLAGLMAGFRFEVIEDPVPVAHLTVRARDGISLRVLQR